jgi:hypothetical protein
VARDGSLGGEGPGILRHALATPAPHFTLLINGQAADLAPSEHERCDWANVSGAVARPVGCDLKDGPERAVAQLPLPAGAPVAAP